MNKFNMQAFLDDKEARINLLTIINFVAKIQAENQRRDNIAVYPVPSVTELISNMQGTWSSSDVYAVLNNFVNQCVDTIYASDLSNNDKNLLLDSFKESLRSNSSCESIMMFTWIVFLLLRNAVLISMVYTNIFGSPPDNHNSSTAHAAASNTDHQAANNAISKAAANPPNSISSEFSQNFFYNLACIYLIHTYIQDYKNSDSKQFIQWLDKVASTIKNQNRQDRSRALTLGNAAAALNGSANASHATVEIVTAEAVVEQMHAEGSTLNASKTLGETSTAVPVAQAAGQNAANDDDIEMQRARGNKRPRLTN